jgi:hypothetical protein
MHHSKYVGVPYQCRKQTFFAMDPRSHIGPYCQHNKAFSRPLVLVSALSQPVFDGRVSVGSVHHNYQHTSTLATSGTHFVPKPATISCVM